MYIYIIVCIYIYMHMYIYVYIFIYIFIHIFMYPPRTYFFKYTYIYIYIYKHTPVFLLNPVPLQNPRFAELARKCEFCFRRAGPLVCHAHVAACPAHPQPCVLGPAGGPSGA